MPPLDLTLILAAASSNMGIGRAGTLPWTGLKKEMAYFARVTKRLPPRAPATARNAVIMGRKTWESIPERFRPLAGRLNVVVSSSADGVDVRSVNKKGGKVDVVVWAESFEKAVAFLEGKQHEEKEGDMEEEEESGKKEEVGRVFVIGGGMIYKEALNYPTDG
ncbi:dihydrofolate reductase-like domain-containing protein, partial [Cladorrhinum sp. PSN259]